MATYETHVRRILGAGSTHSIFDLDESFARRPRPEQAVFHCSIWPSVEGLCRFRRLGLEFPSMCCVCGNAATTFLPLARRNLLARLLFRSADLESARIPHCGLHGAKSHAMFAIFLDRIDSPMASVHCYGLNEDFLKELRSKYSAGDLTPPWLFDPTRHPELGWNQGLQQAWMLEAFQPFWNRLSKTEKLAYLDRWNAPADWYAVMMSEDSHFNKSS